MKRADYMRERWKDQRRPEREAGISPVVATVIIVAISIVLALALAFWASGVITSFQSAERAEVRMIFSSKTRINMSIGNTGSNDLTITQILAVQSGNTLSITINPATCTGGLSLPVTLAPGSRRAICLTGTFPQGSTVEVIVVSSTGNSYRSFAFIP